MAKYWSAVDLLKQISLELGLPVQTTTVNVDNPQGSQLLAALNSGGNELLLYYPWEQLAALHTINLVANEDEYPLPPDWKYYRDQTQWDQTNQWPLCGPKSAAEWARIQTGVYVSIGLAYRIKGDKVCF